MWTVWSAVVASLGARNLFSGFHSARTQGRRGGEWRACADQTRTNAQRFFFIPDSRPMRRACLSHLSPLTQRAVAFRHRGESSQHLRLTTIDEHQVLDASEDVVHPVCVASAQLEG